MSTQPETKKTETDNTSQWRTGTKHPSRVIGPMGTAYCALPVDEDSPTQAEVELAAFIVEACNAHAALLAENKRLRDAVKGLLPLAEEEARSLEQLADDDHEGYDERQNKAEELIAIARAALAKPEEAR